MRKKTNSSNSLFFFKKMDSGQALDGVSSKKSSMEVLDSEIFDG